MGRNALDSTNQHEAGIIFCRQFAGEPHLPQRGTHHTVAAPPIFHPGAHTKQVDVTLKREGSPELASGSVTLDMDLGGGFKGDSIVKPLARHGDEMERLYRETIDSRAATPPKRPG